MRTNIEHLEGPKRSYVSDKTIYSWADVYMSKPGYLKRFFSLREDPDESSGRWLSRFLKIVHSGWGKFSRRETLLPQMTVDSAAFGDRDNGRIYPYDGLSSRSLTTSLIKDRFFVVAVSILPFLRLTES
jgi:hypothetical protein